MEEKWRKVAAYNISRPGKEGRINNPCGESTNKIISLCENLGYCNLHNVLRHGDRRESNTDSLHQRRLLTTVSVALTLRYVEGGTSQTLNLPFIFLLIFLSLT